MQICLDDIIYVFKYKYYDFFVYNESNSRDDRTGWRIEPD